MTAGAAGAACCTSSNSLVPPPAPARRLVQEPNTSISDVLVRTGAREAPHGLRDAGGPAAAGGRGPAAPRALGPPGGPAQAWLRPTTTTTLRAEAEEGGSENNDKLIKIIMII